MREYVLVFLIAASATYLLTVIAREIALRTGAVARVRDRDVHDEPIPYLGGLAMLGGMVAAYLVARQLPFLSGSGPFVFRDAGIVLIAGALICAVGVLDDLFELDALTKLGGQVLASGFLIAFGIQYFFIPQTNGEFFLLDPAQGALLTGFVVVATINAVNFVDGLDGLAAGVVMIGALSFFVFCYKLAAFNDASRATTAALLSVALAGACAGFLPHNFHPARLFMGDSGSMLIGLVLSASAITLSGQFQPGDLTEGASGSQASLLPTLLPVLLPISILVVPLLDLLFAVVRRTRAGRSPFAPDKQHLHHRLLEIGHSQRRAVLIMWLWAALVAFGTVLASIYAGPLMWSSLGAMTLVTIALTFLLPVLHKPKLLEALEAEDPPGELVSEPPRPCDSFHERVREPVGTQHDSPVAPPRSSSTERPPTMTTASKQVRPDTGTTVLLGAAAVTIAIGLVLTLVGLLTDGQGAALGALFGTAVVVGVLTLGSLTVNAVATIMPAASLLVALLTYLLQLLVLLVVFVALERSGLLDGTLLRGWIAAAVIAGTLVWMAAQVRLATTRRIPVYDLPVGER